MDLALSSTLAPVFFPAPAQGLSGGRRDTIEDMLARGVAGSRKPISRVRLDYLKQPLAAVPKIHRFLETHQYVTAIGTCRRADNGGKFKDRWLRNWKC